MLKVRKPSTEQGSGMGAETGWGGQTSDELGVDLPSDVANERELGGASAAPAVTADEELATAADPAEYAALGEHVASVVKAANEAAARIRREAQDDAARVAEVSRQEAVATLSEANRDADKVLFEADQRRAEGDETARATCAAAEAYAERHRREAHEEASRLIAAADQEAARRGHETAERYAALQDNVAQTEQRLEQLVGGLRELATRLEDVLRPAVSDGDGASAPAASAEEAT